LIKQGHRRELALKFKENVCMEQSGTRWFSQALADTWEREDIAKEELCEVKSDWRFFIQQPISNKKKS
jgi:hypothetical protein